MRFIMRAAGFAAGVLLPLGLPAQKQAADQWPVYQYNSDF